MSKRGKKNVYICNKCGQSIQTIDRAEGVTPFTVSCLVTSGCGGQMQSCFYKVPPNLVAQYEWYKPTDDELEVHVEAHYEEWVRNDDRITHANVREELAQHITDGGLLLRRVPRQVPDPKSP